MNNTLRQPVCDEWATVKDICAELARRPMQFVIAFTEDGQEVTVFRNIAREPAKEILERAQEVI